MIYYQKQGMGQAVILLHSGGMAGEEWQPQIKSLAARYQVFIPDLPGHGKSLLREGEQLNIDLIGREIITLMDHEHIESANICGSSMGGAAALWLALNYPQRVKRLVIYRMTYRTNHGLYEQVAQMADPIYWQQFRLDKWLSKLHEPQGGSKAWQEVIQRVSQVFNPNTSTHRYDLEVLEKISCPVLLIAGDRDPVAPLSEVVAMYQHIPDSGLLVFPFADHITGSNTWRAEAFTEELRRFFSREKNI